MTKNDEIDTHNSETLLQNDSAIPIKSTVEYVESETKILYPITQAVKEWMNKTREVTPDVELLKSPNTIYKEFCASDESDDDETIVSEVCVQKNGQAGNSLKNVEFLNNEDEVRRVAEDEVTLFSIEDISEETEQQDLLDYWENDLENVEQNKMDCTTKQANECSKFNSNDKIEQGEDVLEVYESKYGQNEDYLKLQAEISSRKTKQYTRQGNLPYSRAICCNLM